MKKKCYCLGKWTMPIRSAKPKKLSKRWDAILKTSIVFTTTHKDSMTYRLRFSAFCCASAHYYCLKSNKEEEEMNISSKIGVKLIEIQQRATTVPPWFPPWNLQTRVLFSRALHKFMRRRIKLRYLSSFSPQESNCLQFLEYTLKSLFPVLSLFLQ